LGFDIFQKSVQIHKMGNQSTAWIQEQQRNSKRASMPRLELQNIFMQHKTKRPQVWALGRRLYATLWIQSCMQFVLIAYF
jgi:hypothetical protein